MQITLIVLAAIVGLLWLTFAILNSAGPPRRALVHDGVDYQVKLCSRLARLVDVISPGTLQEFVVGRCIHCPREVLGPGAHAHGFGHVRQVIRREKGSRFRGFLSLLLEHPYKGLLSVIRGGHFYSKDHPLEKPVVEYAKEHVGEFQAAMLDPITQTVAIVPWSSTEPLFKHYKNAGVIQ